MLWHTKHIVYIPMVQKSSVCTLQTCQIECYCNQNIYPVYQWFWKGQFAHVKHAKWNVIALRTYTLYTNGSEIVGSHMSNMPNKMILHFKHITYIPMVQKLPVCTCQTGQIKCYFSEHIPCIPMVQKLSVRTSQPCQIKWYCIYPIYQWFRNHQFAHVKQAK